MKNKSLYVSHAALIAALYAVLTLLSYFFGLDKAIFQIRLSEILTVLPAFSPAAVPGLFVGCILAGFITNALPLDIVFGSIATLIGAYGSYALGKKNKYLATLPPVIANAAVVPFIIKFVYKLEGTLPSFFFPVSVSEFITAGIFGAFLIRLLIKKNFSPKA